MMRSLTNMLVAVLVGGVCAVEAYAQPASVTWNLTAPDSMHVSSISGNITAQDQLLTNLAVPASGGYTTNNAQRTSAKDGGTDGNWPAESGENLSRYMQFTVVPNQGMDLVVNSISFYLWVNSGSNMRANVYYSTDPTFSARTQIGSTFTLGTSAPGSPNVSATPGLTVQDGQAFYVRVYPWYTTSTTGKYVLTKTVVISGVTSTAGSSIAPSTESLSGFTQAVGVPSAVQTYTVSGTGLTASVVLTPPAGFEVSSDGGGSWGNSSSPITLPVNGGVIIGQPVSIGVRMNAGSGGPYSGNLTHTSTGVTTAYVALSGFALAAEPSTQSTLSFGEVTGSSIVVNFTGGNGNNRILVAKSGNAVTFAPSDGNPIAGVNANFSSAADQGGGNKVVYDGSGTAVTVTGLSQNTPYHFAVYEYNVGSGNSQNYNTTNPGTGSQTTLAVPTITVTPGSLAFGGVAINSISIEKTYSLSAGSLTPSSGIITVTAPSAYEVSLTSGSGFASSVSVPYSSGTLGSTVIYARFLPTALTSYPGTITNAGGSAPVESVVVSGTGIPPSQQNVFEAENGILTSGYISTQYPGYSGTGYVDIADKTGAALEVDFRRASAATDTVQVYFANGATSRAYAVTVNGVSVGSLTFPNTGGWSNWSSVVMMVPLQGGVNRLKFASTTNNSNANIDKVYIGGQSATPVYKLVLAKSGVGSVSAVPASADSFYDAGTEVTLTASPTAGNSFYKWSGTSQSSSNPYIITMDSHQTEIGVMPANPGFGQFPYEAAPKGFASVGAFTYPNGTTGGTGPGAQTVYVTNSDDLGSILLRRVDVNHTLNFPPLTIYVVGTLTTGSVVTSMCDVKDVYDISIIGVGVDATLSGFGLNVVRAKNIIIRNLKIQNSPIDGITVQANDVEGTGNHLWFDHNTITNCYDGALDVTHTASYVTVSWNHFYNHDKTCLMGHSDSQTSDVAMKVTYHHNYFDSTTQRHPRVRYGKAHVFNNYYHKNTLYGISSNDGAAVVVEGSYFLNVPLPMDTSRDGSIPGDVVERNNLFVNCGPYQTRGTAFDPSAYYSYSVDDPASIPSMVSAYSGAGKWDFSSGGIETPMPPGVPTLVSPPNGSTGLPLTQVLSWRLNPNTVTYRVQCSTDSTFSSFLVLDSTLADTSCTVSGLQNSTTYFWRVRGNNNVGAGAFSIPWKFRTVPPSVAGLGFSLSSINFGNRYVNSVSTDTLKVRSVGSLTLAIDSIRVYGGAFSANPTSAVSVPAGDSLRVAVTFGPTSVGLQQGLLVVFSNAPTSPDSVNLVGTGVQAGFSATPASISFGDVAVGATGTDSITVSNPGTGILVIDSAWAQGGEFSVVPATLSIAPGGSGRFVVTFEPTSSGEQTGFVVFNGNAPGLPDSVIITGNGVNSLVSLDVPISAGWNMISSPLTNPVPDDSARHIFPTLVSRVFEFSSGYIARDLMVNGVGYWGKFPASVMNVITGTSRLRDSISVNAGWNMIGSISARVDTSTITSIPPGLRQSNWFGWSGGGYSVASQLAPGKAFWVKVNGSGKFILAGTAAMRIGTLDGSVKSPLDELNSVTISNGRGESQTLYFGSDGLHQINLALFAMPPLPPMGVLDARFETKDGGSLVQTHETNVARTIEFPIAIQSDDYPLTVRWQIAYGSTRYEIAAGASASQRLGPSGSMLITNGEVKRIVLRVTGDEPVPRKFFLSQNYPNPFNPSTEITFSVEVLERTVLSVHNVLGQQIAVLFDEIAEPGRYYTVRWNAGDYASGLYFYTLRSGKSFEIGKMTLIK